MRLKGGLVVMTTYSDFRKNFIIFGAGRKGKECYALLKQQNRHISFFTDNDAAKWGNDIDGIPIRRPVDIKKSDPRNTLIVIACEGGEQAIRRQLICMGIYVEYSCTSFLELCMLEMKPYYLEQDRIIQSSYPNTKECEKLLYDFQIFAEHKNGGVSRYFHEIIRRIAMRCNVDLFEGLNESDNSLIHQKGSFNRYYRRDGEGIWECRNILNCSLFHSFVKNRKYKIYHPTYYHDYELDNSGACIITVYDMIHELYQMHQNTISEKKNMIFKADGIIAISENTKKDLINIYNVDEKKIKVIYLANSLAMNVTSPRIVKEPYILYVGNRGGYKNAETLLYAFAGSRYKKNLKIVFFSGGAFSDREKQIITELKLENDIEQLFGDDVVLANLYKYAEIFVYPSLYEGFGLPILEAMHYGTPVITSDSSSLPEVGGDAAVYFTPDSADELAECMDRLLDDKEQRRKMGQAGMLWEKMFSWDKCAEEHMKLYEQFF